MMACLAEPREFATMTTAIQDEVDHNFDAFQRLLPEIISQHRGAFALMHNREIVTYFTTPIDAHAAGEKLFPDGVFSIQQVTDTSWVILAMPSLIEYAPSCRRRRTMTELLPPIFWLNPALSQSLAKTFELQREWNAREWDAIRKFHGIMRIDVPSVAETEVLPGVFVDAPPNVTR